MSWKGFFTTIGIFAWIWGVTLFIHQCIASTKIYNMKKDLDKTKIENLKIKNQRDSIQIEYYKLVGKYENR